MNLPDIFWINEHQVFKPKCLKASTKRSAGGRVFRTALSTRSSFLFPSNDDEFDCSLHKQQDHTQIQRWDARKSHPITRWPQTQDAFDSLREATKDVKKGVSRFAQVSLKHDFYKCVLVSGHHMRSNNRKIRSSKQLLQTIHSNKNFVSACQDKLFIQNDGIVCITFGHYEIGDWQLHRKILEDDDWGDEER